MEIEQFKQLVYAKGFGTTLTQKLLRIADSSMAKELIFEDLLGLIWEYAEYTYEPASEPDCNPFDICDDCNVGEDAENARDRANTERDAFQKDLTNFKKGLCDILNLYENYPHVTLEQIRKKLEEVTGVEPTGNTGIGITAPAHLIHMKCECGKELYVEGPGWTIDFQGGPVVFKCSCGKTFTMPEFECDNFVEIISLCTACEAVDKSNPPCNTCERPVCPECEADDPNDPPCSTCERNRPHA